MNPVCYLMLSAMPAQRICLCFKPTCRPCLGAIYVAACLPVSRPPARVRASLELSCFRIAWSCAVPRALSYTDRGPYVRPDPCGALRRGRPDRGRPSARPAPRAVASTRNRPTAPRLGGFLELRQDGRTRSQLYSIRSSPRDVSARPFPVPMFFAATLLLCLVVSEELVCSGSRRSVPANVYAQE